MLLPLLHALLPSLLFSLPPTAPVVRLLTYGHIAAGSLALLTGLVPMLGRKGGPLHRRAGRLYVGCMLGMAASAVGLCALQPLSFSHLFLSGVAVLSCYLSFTGWRAARRRGAPLAALDVALAAGALLVGVAMLGAGAWLGAGLLAFFGGLLMVFAGLDTGRGLRPVPPVAGPAAWLIRHFTRLGGSYISATTAFVVVNLGHWLPAGAPAWLGLAGWLAPTVVGTALILKVVARYRRPAGPGIAAGLLLAGVAPTQAQLARPLAGQLTAVASLPLPSATVGGGAGRGPGGRRAGPLSTSVTGRGASHRPGALWAAGLRAPYASRGRAAGPLRLALPGAAVALIEGTVRPGGLDTVYVGNPYYRTRRQTAFALGSQLGQPAGSEIGRVFQLPRQGA